MIEKISNKKNIVFYLNIFIIIFLFIIVLNYQKYSFLYEHEYFWNYNFQDILQRGARLWGAIINYFYTYLSLLNKSPMDFKSGFGAIITSIIYLLICCIFAKGFFILKTDKRIFLNSKIFIFPIVLSSLLLTIPIFYLNSDYLLLHYMNLDEINHFSEYYIGYIFLFLFYGYLFEIIIHRKKYNNLLLFFICFLGFILGSYNEYCSLSVAATLLLIILYSIIFEHELLKNKTLKTVICSFFLGFIFMLITGDYIKGHSLNTLSYNLFDSITENLKHYQLFFSKYFGILFIKKRFFWLILIILCMITFFTKSDYLPKQKKNIIVLSIFIPLGYVLACLLEILIYNILPNYNYVFEREYDNCFQCHLFEFTILVLFGYIFYNSNRLIKNIMIIFLSITIISLSFILQNKYFVLTEQKLQTKLLAYKIEKTLAVYSIFGESALLNAEYLKNWNLRNGKIFTMQDQFEYRNKDNFEEFMKNKYFNKPYSLYSEYYNKQYKNKFIGFQFTDNKKANEELEKRLNLLEEKIETDDEIIHSSIRFKPIEKYGNRILTIKDIENLEQKNGKNDVLTKAKGYVNYKDGNYEQAINLYNEFLRSNPNDFDALINLAEIYKYQNNYKQAKECYKKLISLDDNNLTFKYNYLQIIFNYEKDYNQALKICDNMINTEPKMGANYINKGLVLIALDEPEKAKETFEKEKKLHYFEYKQMLKENEINNIQELLQKDKNIIKLIPATF